MRAWSLIELVGVLAVIAIIAAVVVPALIRRMDLMAAEQEASLLKGLGNALQQSILRNRYIPSATNWSSVVAAEMGIGEADVTGNPRRGPRLFLIDPGLQVGVNGGQLPYQQNNSGSVLTTNGEVVAPMNMRVMILSSIGPALPAGITSGMPSRTEFGALWDWNDAGDVLPVGPPWVGWAGGTADLKLHRINLGGLFVRLLLTTYASDGDGRYSMDWMGTNGVPGSTGIDAWFLQNSVLGLHTHTGTLDSQQVLRQDSSFVYDQNAWRGSIAGVTPLGGMDVGAVVDKFLAAPANPRAPAGQQQVVVQKMMDYMTAYEAWQDAGFPSQLNNPVYQTARNAQSVMMQAVQTLYQDPHDPVEVACPP